MPHRFDVNQGYETACKVFWERNSKYGTQNISEDGVDGVVIRLKDKLARLQSLNRLNPVAMGTEPLEDTALDVCNYGLILWLLIRGKWEGDSPTLNSVVLEPETPESVAPRLLVKRLVPDHDGICEPKKEGDVGFDIVVSEDVTIPAHAVGFNVPSHAAVKVPDGFFMMILNRSSAIKRNLIVVPGIIDQGYTGPIFSIVNNQTDVPVVLSRGDRVAQGILLPRFVPPLEWVAELPETARGETGFGSTG